MKIKFSLIFLLVLLSVLFIGNNSVLALGGTFYANDPINYNCSNSKNYVWLFPDTGGSKTVGGFSCVEAGIFFYARYGDNAVHYFVMEKTRYNCGNLTWNQCLETVGGDPVATFEFQYYPTLAPAPPPTIATTNLPVAEVSSPYSQTLQALGGTTPYTWSVISGNLPTGLTLNSSTGEISGIPTDSYDYNFTVQVADANSKMATQALSISVNPPVITTAAFLSANIGESYSQILEVAGGVAPYNWSLFRGNLPSGLNLNGSTGVISGIPTAAGVYAFIVKVQDNHLRVTTRNLVLKVKPFMGGGTFYANDPINYNCSDSNNYVWIFTDTGGSKSLAGLPFAESGVFFDRYGNTVVHYFVMEKTSYNCGNLTWYECSITGRGDLIATFEFQYYPILAPSITTTSLLDAAVGTVYSQTLQATGGTSPFNWSIISGSLPFGLSLNDTTGGIFRVPTTVEMANFTVQVTDVNNRTAIKDLSITVHGNTPIGSNVQATSGNTTLTFSSVTQEGNTSVASSSSGTTPPSGFKLGNPPTYYAISTTAVFTAPVEICVNYDEDQFRNENNLKLSHFENGQWVNVTTALDTINNVICGETSSFSEFTLFENLDVDYIIDEVLDFNLDEDIEQGLLDKLNAAKSAIERGQNKTARNILKAFINQVKAQKSKKITNEQANMLIADTNEFIEVLGGGSLLSRIGSALVGLWNKLSGLISSEFR